MNQFSYTRVNQQQAAIDAIKKDRTAMFIAGGTNLTDLMKRGIARPERLIDINRLPLREISGQKNSLTIGALALNSDVAENSLVLKKQPLLVQALNSGASPQIRNMATVGGNMLQRTRCPYFYDTSLPCNKREPGSGCGALEGINRTHAIFGFSDKCIAVHPSDMSVALAALDAKVLVTGPKGIRHIQFTNFHRLPGETPETDTNLQPNELILSVDIPDNSFTKNVHYLKVRERASYAFALVSVASALHIEKNIIKDVRLAMGGVAHKPWRLQEAESYLKGKPVSEASFLEAARISMQGARAFKHNAYKLKLASNSIVHALKVATKMS